MSAYSKEFMFLEKIVEEDEDLTEIPQEDLQRRILGYFIGEERTQAILEYCTIFRNYRHKLWILNLKAHSDSKDIVSAVSEWRRSNTANMYSLKAGCDLDGAPITRMHHFINTQNGYKVVVGSRCAQKIEDQLIFRYPKNYAQKEHYEGDEGDERDMNIKDMIMWYLSQDESTFSKGIASIVKRMKENRKVISLSEHEERLLTLHHDNTRQCLPIQIIGEDKIESLRNAFGQFREYLPSKIEQMIFGDKTFTRNEIYPLSRHLDEKEMTDFILRNTLWSCHRDKTISKNIT